MQPPCCPTSIMSSCSVVIISLVIFVVYSIDTIVAADYVVAPEQNSWNSKDGNNNLNTNDVGECVANTKDTYDEYLIYYNVSSEAVVQVKYKEVKNNITMLKEEDLVLYITIVPIKVIENNISTVVATITSTTTETESSPTTTVTATSSKVHNNMDNNNDQSIVDVDNMTDHRQSQQKKSFSTTTTRYIIVQQPTAGQRDLDILWEQQQQQHPSFLSQQLSSSFLLSLHDLKVIHNDTTKYVRRPPLIDDGTTMAVVVPPPVTKKKTTNMKHRQHQEQLVTDVDTTQLQYHRWYRLNMTLFPYLYYFSTYQTYRYYYTIHSVYIPEHQLILYNVTTTIPTTTTTSFERGECHNDDDSNTIVVLYGSTYLLLHNNSDVQHSDNLPLERMIHTMDIQWDQLLLLLLLQLPPISWIISNPIIRPILCYIIQYWLQYYIFLPPTTSRIISTTTTTAHTTSQSSIPHGDIINIQVPVTVSTTILSFNDWNYRNNNNSNNNNNNTNTVHHEELLFNSATANETKQRNLLQLSHRWFQNQRNRFFDNSNDEKKKKDSFVTLEVGSISTEHLLSLQPEDDEPIRLVHPQQRMLLNADHSRPIHSTIGLTRYLLICCIIVLSLYNIHLYFSQ